MIATPNAAVSRNSLQVNLNLPKQAERPKLDKDWYPPHVQPGDLSYYWYRAYTRYKDALDTARFEAEALRFEDCLATLDQMMPEPDHVVMYPHFQGLRAYALFRLGKEDDAIVAARSCLGHGVSSGVVRALVSPDPLMRQRLRDHYKPQTIAVGAYRAPLPTQKKTYRDKTAAAAFRRWWVAAQENFRLLLGGSSSLWKRAKRLS